MKKILSFLTLVVVALLWIITPGYAAKKAPKTPVPVAGRAVQYEAVKKIQLQHQAMLKARLKAAADAAAETAQKPPTTQPTTK